MDKSPLVNLIDFWQKASLKNEVLPRDITNFINLKNKEIVDIAGVRRSGKSFILKLLIKNISKKESSLYINFEDPYFIENRKPQIIEEIIEVYKSYFSPQLKYLFFDEIQNIDNWEKAIRKLREGKNYKIFITGSSSKLLSRELSSLLTGRHLSYALFPLSFSEFLNFQKVYLNGKKDIFLKEREIKKEFAKYLEIGGFPEIVLTKDKELLKQYFYDILQKDIISRYDIRQKELLEKIGVFLLTNSAKTISINSLATTYGISHEMANNYLEYFKEAFLLFELPLFSYSLKTQQKALKKIYAVDTGLANVVSFKFSEDKGRILENCVYLSLKRKYNNIYYYKTKGRKKVDFFVKEKNKFLIQVSWEISDIETRNREISALFEAMREQKIKESILLTFETSEEIKEGDLKIKVIPVYQWLLEDGNI